MIANVEQFIKLTFYSFTSFYKVFTARIDRSVLVQFNQFKICSRTASTILT